MRMDQVLRWMWVLGVSHGVSNSVMVAEVPCLWGLLESTYRPSRLSPYSPSDHVMPSRKGVGRLRGSCVQAPTLEDFALGDDFVNKAALAGMSFSFVRVTNCLDIPLFAGGWERQHPIQYGFLKRL